MPEPFIPAQQPQLAQRLETCCAWRGMRYAEAYGRLHPEAGSASLAVAGGYASFAAPGSPVNNTRGLGMHGPVCADDLAAVEEFFASRGEATRLHICPLADESLIELTAARGYRLIFFFSVLARVIPADFQPAPLPESLRVTRAQPGEAALWVRTSAQGFEGSDDPNPAALDILGPNFSAEDSLPFFAWSTSDGGLAHAAQPTGCGGMYLAPQARAFELGGASTLPRYRRRGVQTALIEARLAEGLRRGCDLAMVLTEPGSNSQRNLDRAGFSLVYTKAVVRKDLTRGNSA